MTRWTSWGQRANNVALSVLLALLGCMGVGCKHTYHTYSPDDNRVAGVYEPIVELKAKRSVAVTVVTLQDKTGEEFVGGGRRIGCINVPGNGAYGMFMESGDGSMWVADALTQELTRAGCVVTKSTTMPVTGDAVVINGSVGKFFVDVFAYGYHCDIQATVVVSRNGLTQLNKTFEANGKAPQWWGSKPEFQDVIKETVQSLMREVVPEVLSVVDAK